MKKQCANFATSIRTISKCKPSTRSRCWLLVTPRLTIRACRSSLRLPACWKSCGNKMRTILESSITSSMPTIILSWPNADWLRPKVTMKLRHGCHTRCICRHTSLRVWECGMNQLKPIALRPKLRALTRPCAIATLPKPKNCTRSITWLIHICRKLRTPRRKRLSTLPRKCRRRIRSWNSARPTHWPRFQHVTHLSGTIGRRRQSCPFRTCRTGLRSRSWKLSSNMVTRSDARTPATSTAREKRSHECSNCATRRKSKSSIISKVISSCRCKQLRHGWLQLKAKRTT